MPQQDKLVIVMGPTGTGKSTFINCATGKKLCLVHHGLRPMQSDIQTVHYNHPNQNRGSFVFVDTPGFNGPSNDDGQILKLITSYLEETYKENAKLATIIYLHKIDDNRMPRSVLEALKILESLCAGKASPNVIIATTMWANVSKEEGEQREGELDREFLPTMDRGKSLRFQRTYESAWDIIGSVTEKDQMEGLLVTEIIDNGRQLVLKPDERHKSLKRKLKGIFSRFIAG